MPADLHEILTPRSEPARRSALRALWAQPPGPVAPELLGFLTSFRASDSDAAALSAFLLATAGASRDDVDLRTRVFPALWSDDDAIRAEAERWFEGVSAVAFSEATCDRSLFEEPDEVADWYIRRVLSQIPLELCRWRDDERGLSTA